jgi:hypothetical protein
MSIQIVSNPNANAIELRGTNRGVFYNACLSGAVNLTDGDRVDILNDVRTSAEGSTVYEAYAIHYSELLDGEGNGFANAQEAADYITSECNQIVGSGAKVVGPTGAISFNLDQTHTTILISDGSAFPVNSIKAVAGADGHIEIWEHGDNGVQLYDDIYLAFCTAAGSLVPQTLSGAVNALNSLFNVSPVGSGAGFTPAYPTLDGVAITPVSAGGQDPVGDNIFGGTSTSQHGARYRSTEYIDAPGEYFTFRMANHGQFLFGLGSVANSDIAEFDASSGSGHSGFFYSQAMYDYGSYMAPWTTYGSHAGLSYGPGWSFYGNDPMFRYSQAQQNMADGNDALFKVEIMAEGFVGCYYYDVDETNDWILLSRSSTPLPEGNYFLGIKLASPSGQLVEVPLRWATDDAAPVMGYRYIESPDGSFDYPLFNSAEQAEWYDLNVASPAGSGQSSQVTYVDDAAPGTIWFRPVAEFTQAGSTAPASTSERPYTEIATLADGLFAPASFTLPDHTVNEGQPVNIQVAPSGGVSYTTAVSGLPSGLSFDGGTVVQGTTPQVAGDNVANPSDASTVTVTRSNAYGSTQTNFVITITNTTQPVTPVAGATHVAGTPSLVDSDTLADGSVIHFQNELGDEQRLVIDQSYVETYILPALSAGGSGSSVWVGIESGSADFGTGVDASDFDGFIRWDWASASSHTVTLAGDSTNALTVNSLTDSVYDYAIEANDTRNDAYFIGCNINSINTEPSPFDGGTFARSERKTSLPATPHTIAMAVVGGTLDFLPSALSEIAVPAAAASTSWDKALDFSGSSERTSQANSHYLYTPLAMGGSGSTVSAPSTTQGHPWATAVVFKLDSTTGPQHVWNFGEGAGSTDDNVYLRIGSGGALYFGWGRQGALNERLIVTNLGTAAWYGCYIGHKGGRLSGSNATSSNLSAQFDIKVMFNSGGSWIFNPNPNGNGAGVWSTTGGRMDRSIVGSMTIGGRGSNRSFHGQVASMVSTTLRTNSSMPSNAEIEAMITDPVQWMADYKVGNPFRLPSSSSDASSNWAMDSADSSYGTQVWLMGDGASDSYPNIDNRVAPVRTNTRMEMTNMVSNDIQTVSIPGLT